MTGWALAGGQTLVNVMKQRAASPDVLVDLNDLADLRAIRIAGDRLELGAMATYSALIASSEVDVARPIIGEVAATIADLQVRNRGTVGGNVCSNDPTNHLPPLLVALDATFTIQGRGGTRWVSAEDFFLGVYLTAVGEGELLTTVALRRPGMPRTALPRSRSGRTAPASSASRPRSATTHRGSRSAASMPFPCSSGRRGLTTRQARP